MDPDEALRELRAAIATSHKHPYGSDAWCRATDALVVHATNIDTWLTNGGFTPADWPSTDTGHHT